MTETEQHYYSILHLSDKIDSIANVFQNDIDTLLTDRIISKQDLEADLIEIKNQFDLIEHELSRLKEKSVSILEHYINEE